MKKVTVIIPNHSRDLTVALQSIKNSTYHADALEINRGFERSLQRNMGIVEAKGEYLLFLDSDQSISPGLIQECVELMDCGYSCVYIPEVIVAKSFFGRIRAFEREFYTGTAVDVPRFVKNKCCPMFDTGLNGPEDSDWGNRIEGLRSVSQNVLYHHDDIPFLEYCKKKAYYSKSMKRYADKWPNDRCLDLTYRCVTVFVEKGKWKKILRHPILSLGIIFVLIVRGIIYYVNS